jgi:hypothetical protein
MTRPFQSTDRRKYGPLKSKFRPGAKATRCGQPAYEVAGRSVRLPDSIEGQKS